MKTVKVYGPQARRALTDETRVPESYEDAIELLHSKASTFDRRIALQWLRAHAADDERAFRVCVVETLADIYYKGDRFVPSKII